MINYNMRTTIIILFALLFSISAFAQKKVILLASNYDQKNYYIKNNRMVFVQLNNQTKLNGFIKIENDSIFSIKGRHFHKDSIESITTKSYSKDIHRIVITSLGSSLLASGVGYYMLTKESDDGNGPKDDYYATIAGDACLVGIVSGITGSTVLLVSTLFKKHKFFDTKGTYNIKVLNKISK